MLVYPNKEENNAGRSLEIQDIGEKRFKIVIFGEYYFIDRGKVACYTIQTDGIFIKKNPIDQSSNLYEITSPILIKILEVKDNWVLTELKLRNKKIRGWINKEFLCDSPYTTCS